MNKLKPKAARATRTTKAAADIEAAVATLNRLQEQRLVVEAQLARHTGIFGSGLFKMSDPENDALLESIKTKISAQLANVEEGRQALTALEASLAKRRSPKEKKR